MRRCSLVLLTVCLVACTPFEASEEVPDAAPSPGGGGGGGGGGGPDAGAGDAGQPDGGAVVDPLASAQCPDGTQAVGAVTTFSGKVNVHAPAREGIEKQPPLNGWYTDDDCRSGASEPADDYCRKLFPKATFATAPRPADATLKPFYTERCGERGPATGQKRYDCCAPL